MLAIPAYMALLQSTNIWVSDSGASVNFTNNRCGGSNVHEGSGAGAIGAHSKAMTSSSIMDTAEIWCKEQLKAMLKDVQNNSKSNFNLFSIGKATK